MSFEITFISGKRVGQICGARVVSGLNTCKRHIGKSVSIVSGKTLQGGKVAKEENIEANELIDKLDKMCINNNDISCIFGYDKNQEVKYGLYGYYVFKAEKFFIVLSLILTTFLI